VFRTKKIFFGPEHTVLMMVDSENGIDKATIRENFGPVLQKDGISEKDLGSILDCLEEKKIIRKDENGNYARGPLFWNYKDTIEKEVNDIKKEQRSFILWLIPLILSVSSLTLSIVKQFEKKEPEQEKVPPAGKEITKDTL
jgi:hypothetical protein